MRRPEQVTAVVFDWAGTTVDHGSLAPIRALVQAFDSLGLDVPVAAARDGMGLAKRDHIAHLLASGPAREAFVESFGRAPNDADVDRVYGAFLPVQTAVIREGGALISGVLDCVAELRTRGLRIGSTTGYTRPLLDALLETAARAGYVPDAAICPDDVGAGRPSPLMLYANAVQLRRSPLSSFVKVGDTPADIEEGRAAGTWSVGVAATGNEVGLDAAQLDALSAEERDRVVGEARDRLCDAGADFVIDDLRGLPKVLDEINERLAAGERPAIS